jgi:hypothetical protein
MCWLTNTPTLCRRVLKNTTQGAKQMKWMWQLLLNLEEHFVKFAQSFLTKYNPRNFLYVESIGNFQVPKALSAASHINS